MRQVSVRSAGWLWNRGLSVSSYFVPAVLVSAVITFIVWSLVGPEPRLAHAIVNAVAVLIIACRCALGLATPMSIIVGTGRGATAGVLIKNAEALEVMEKIDTLIVKEGETVMFVLFLGSRSKPSTVLSCALTL